MHLYNARVCTRAYISSAASDERVSRAGHEIILTSSSKLPLSLVACFVSASFCFCRYTRAIHYFTLLFSTAIPRLLYAHDRFNFNHRIIIRIPRQKSVMRIHGDFYRATAPYNLLVSHHADVFADIFRAESWISSDFVELPRQHR